MKTHADKTQENKNQAVAKEVPKQTDGEFTVEFEDNRPEAIALRKFQDMVDNRPQARQRQQIERMFGSPIQKKEALPEEELQMKAEAAPVQRKGPEEEELLQGKFEPVQKKGPEEEELLQGKFDGPIQKKGPEEEELLQGKFEPIQKKGLEENELQMKEDPVQKKENKTGLPDNLKSDIENLSGYSMDDVKVHRNSDTPAQLNAHAYTQGTDIHVGSGQEKHLPHEAWHVVQQKQGRVKPTMQMKGGVSINDDKGLEKEADVMGVFAINPSTNTRSEYKGRLDHNSLRDNQKVQRVSNNTVIQMNEAETIEKYVKAMTREKEEYEKDKTKIKEILNLVDPLPLNIRYLSNRVESKFPKLDKFFVHIESLLLRAPNSKGALKKLKGRLSWYQESNDGKKLIKLTLKDALAKQSLLEHVGKIEERRKVFIAERESQKGTNSQSEVRGADLTAGKAAARKYQWNKENKKYEGEQIECKYSNDTLEYDPESPPEKSNRPPTKTMFGPKIHYRRKTKTGRPTKGWTYVGDFPKQEGNQQTKFMNTYHKSAVIMGQNYRSEKEYYASDAFFDQWLRAAGGKSIFDLPKAFPKYIYRDHIDNSNTEEAINIIKGNEEKAEVKFEGNNWNILNEKKIVNVKSTMTILSEYNKINELRGERKYKLEKLFMYKGPSLKFCFVPE